MNGTDTWMDAGAFSMTVVPDEERCEKSSIDVSGLGVSVVEDGGVLRICGDVIAGYDAHSRFPLHVYQWHIAAVLRDKEGGSLGWAESCEIDLLWAAPCSPFKVDIKVGEFDMVRVDRVELYPFAKKKDADKGGDAESTASSPCDEVDGDMGIAFGLEELL